MNQLLTELEMGDCAYANTSATFNWLYNRYWSDLVKQSNYFVKDEDSAKEIVQELFTDVFQKNSLIKVTGNLDAYLRMATKNRSLNYLLKQKRYNDHLKKWGTKKEKLAENVIEEDINLIYVQKQIQFYLSQLNESCREVFLLSRDRQMTVKEIAQKLQRPPDTVAKQLSKAVRYLYKCMYPGQNN
jgi:RNA polymerase sigma-70 factor (ECF subfamily)